MTFSRHQRHARAQEQAAATAAHNAATVSPDPNGNRAQRRAWAKTTRQPLGRRYQAQIADTIRRVTSGKALEVAAFNSSID